jgi:hypothetical protein
MSRILQAYMDGIYDWIYYLYPSKTIIWNNQDAPRPTTDYILLGVVTPAVMDCSADKQYLTTNKVRYITYESMTISINVYSQDDYMNIINKIIRSQYFDEVRLLLKKKGLAIRKSMNPVDLSALEDTAFTNRCQCDFLFSYVAKEEVTTPRISRIAGDIDGINFDVEQ